MTAVSTVVTSDLGEHRERWDELVLADARPSPFLRTWWLDAVADDRARYVLVLADGHLVGGAPLQVQQRHGVGRVDLLGAQLNPTGLDVVAGEGQSMMVADRLWRSLRARSDLIVDLAGLRPGSALEAVARPASVRDLPEAPYLVLPESHEQYFAARSSKFRKSVRQARRRLEGLGYRHRVLPPADVPLGLDELHRLHAQRFGDVSVFLPNYERFRQAAQVGAARGELVFDVIEREGSVAAVSAVMQVGEVVVGYQSGRDVQDPHLAGAGSVLLDHIIARACEAGMRELDFQGYPDDYKMRLATGTRPIRVIRSHWGPRARTVMGVRRARARLRRARQARAAGTGPARAPSLKARPSATGGPHA